MNKNARILVLKGDINVKKGEFSLGEGNTPIVKAVRIPFYLKSNINLYFKNESYNPTGSHIDRGIFRIFERIIDRVPEAIIAYSDTGEVAMSIAAYSSRLGMNAYIFTAKEEYKTENFEKLTLYDAKVIVVNDKKENIITMLREIAKDYPLFFINLDSDEKFIKGEEGIVKEIVNKIGKVDYGFLGIEKGEEQIYYFFKSLFEKNGILIGGATTDKEFAIKNDLIYLEDFEIEEAYYFLIKQEGVIVDKRAAIGLAGILKWDRINGFECGETVVQIIDKVEYRLKEKLMEEYQDIINIDLNYEGVLDILKLKKIKV